MLNLILFLPKVAIFGATMGSVNFFKKKRTAELPATAYHVSFGPVFGIDMKKLVKGMEKVLGKTLENTITELSDGFKADRAIGMASTPFTDVEGLIAYAQGNFPEDPHHMFHTRARLHSVTALVSAETLTKLHASKFICVFHEDEHTQSVYEAHRRFKATKFFDAAIKVLNGMGDLPDECYECERDLLHEGVDLDGDCRSCGADVVCMSELHDTMKMLEKQAA